MSETFLLDQSQYPFPYQVPMLTDEKSVGVIVVGESQAGKTTALEIIKGVLTEIDPEGLEPIAFPLSNGFRGMSVDMLEWSGTDFAHEIEDHRELKEMVARFAGHVTLNEEYYTHLTHEFYAKPRPKDILRSKAVESVVAAVSADPNMHLRVFDAAGRFLQTTMSNPDTARRATVLDGRNEKIIADLMRQGGLSIGGLVIMTCAAEDTVRRRMLRESPDATEEEIDKEIKKLERRNDSDRGRGQDVAVGRTTLPRDLPNVLRLHNFNPDDIPPGRVAEILFMGGVSVSRTPQSAVHIATDNNGLSVEKERQYLPPIVHGMVAGVQERV